MDPTAVAMAIRGGGHLHASVTGLSGSPNILSGSPPTRGRLRASRNRSAGQQTALSGSSGGSSTSIESMQRSFKCTGTARATRTSSDDTRDPTESLLNDSGRPQPPAKGESSRSREKPETVLRQPSGGLSKAADSRPRMPVTKDPWQASSSGKPLPRNIVRHREGLTPGGPQTEGAGGPQAASNRLLNRIPISPFRDSPIAPAAIEEASTRKSSKIATKTPKPSHSVSDKQHQPRDESSRCGQPSISSEDSTLLRGPAQQLFRCRSPKPPWTSTELNVGPGDPQGTRIVGGHHVPPMTAHLIPAGFVTLQATPGGRKIAQSGPHPRHGARPRDSTISLGIEAEFMIAAKDLNFFRETRQAFAAALAEGYNRGVSHRHPRMREALRAWQSKDDYDKWSLILDDSISLSQRSPWGIELVSPILRASPGSKWRADVEAIWRHLHRYYDIETNEGCATHIHISIHPWYSWEEVRRIAQAAIHFEPAFEVLVPPYRRGNKYAKSLWLDSPFLVARNICRSGLIDDIEGTDCLNALIPLIQDSRDYCWNFLPLLDRGTIEFRKPPASKTAEEALSWAEFAISFVQASIKCKSAAELRKIPATVGGLRWFCSRCTEPGVNQPHRLQRIWADHGETEALKPVSVHKGDPSNEWTQRTRKILNTKAEKDIQQIRAFSKTAGRPPYW